VNPFAALVRPAPRVINTWSCATSPPWEATIDSDSRVDLRAIDRVHLSKFLSLVLRHRPGTIGIVLDQNGWVEIAELVSKCERHGTPISADILRDLVATSSKQRFAISEDGLRVRANQGHSVAIDLAYEPKPPPETLFHGTAYANLSSIRVDGLHKMERHHVHLSPDEATARIVGLRRGKPVVLRIASATMHVEGYVFYLSSNGVWLTEHVPAEHIEFPRDALTPL
jgi:putative RNA 2'-phosphotransferase